MRARAAHGGGRASVPWSVAAAATQHWLPGCAIGQIAGAGPRRDTVSIGVMEIVDNLVNVVATGATDAGLTSGLFWGIAVGRSLLS